MAYKPVGVDEDSKFPARVQDQLHATFVRFVDEEGNPFPGDRLVTISVDSATGEIIDIVSEVI